MKIGGFSLPLAALRGQRVNQLHQCAVEQQLIIEGQREGWQTTNLWTFETVFWNLNLLLRRVARVLYFKLLAYTENTRRVYAANFPGPTNGCEGAILFRRGKFPHRESKFTQSDRAKLK
jgi:hypothetical protein